MKAHRLGIRQDYHQSWSALPSLTQATQPATMTCFCFNPLFWVLYAKELIRRNGLSKTTQSNRLVALHIPPPLLRFCIILLVMSFFNPLRHFSDGFNLAAGFCLPVFCQPLFLLTFLSVNQSLLNHFSVNYYFPLLLLFSTHFASQLLFSSNLPPLHPHFPPSTYLSILVFA